MKKLQKLDRKSIKEIRNEISIALSFITKKYGVCFTLGTIRYDQCEMRGKLVGNLPAQVQKKEKEKKKNAPSEWSIFSRSLGFKGDEFGKTFNNGTNTFKVTGINMKARKYPISVQNVKSGKSYRASANMVLLGFYGTTAPQKRGK